MYGNETSCIGMAQSCSPSPVGAVPGSLRALEAAVDSLAAETGVLSQGLAPVLRWANPSDEDRCKEEESPCEMSERINKIRRNVESIASLVSDARSRLEL